MYALHGNGFYYWTGEPVKGSDWACPRASTFRLAVLFQGAFLLLRAQAGGIKLCSSPTRAVSL